MTEYTERHVSTGSLPAAAVVGRLLDDAHQRFRDVAAGRPSSVYPALERADPGLFGISVAAVTGQALSAGDADVMFPIMSVAKPFTFALVRSCWTVWARWAVNPAETVDIYTRQSCLAVTARDLAVMGATWPTVD